jgi:hypothetical protein
MNIPLLKKKKKKRRGNFHLRCFQFHYGTRVHLGEAFERVQELLCDNLILHLFARTCLQRIVLIYLVSSMSINIHNFLQ